MPETKDGGWFLDDSTLLPDYRKVTRRRILSLADVRRAIFVDYEGSTGKPPTLLGVLSDRRLEPNDASEMAFEQLIIEGAFHVCSQKRGAAKTNAADERVVLESLLRRAGSENRLLVSWSEHDLRLMQNAVSSNPALLATLEERYCNGLVTAKRWLWRVRKERFEVNKLANYLDAIRYRVPDRFGLGVAGKAIREIRQQLSERGGAYGDLTDGARKQWRAVVRHNEFDCRGMRELLLRAAKEMETRW